ncbi:YggT family protein [Iamia sp.]|jgi:YggT family protein|uniref:YggT family protein n=1 Tax=Iamia sp. TaxID=2722710 RepID=UPI002CB79FA4|nr:YggT family protein [Iamia sp.]HXH56441.1 YggT family protein [Iamia sp.]
MSPILQLICIAAFVYQLVVLAAIILSWFPIEPGSGLESVRNVLSSLTEPVLGPLRRALPPVRLGAMALDLSPIIVLIGLGILQRFVCG